MTSQDKNEIISRIIELQVEEITAVSEGHKPTMNDYLQPKRDEMDLLRCLLFGYNSEYCKLKKKSRKTSSF